MKNNETESWNGPLLGELFSSLLELIAMIIANY